jgi:hypothetical protein
MAQVPSASPVRMQDVTEPPPVVTFTVTDSSCTVSQCETHVKPSGQVVLNLVDQTKNRTLDRVEVMLGNRRLLQVNGADVHKVFLVRGTRGEQFGIWQKARAGKRDFKFKATYADGPSVRGHCATQMQFRALSSSTPPPCMVVDAP